MNEQLYFKYLACGCAGIRVYMEITDLCSKNDKRTDKITEIDHDMDT